MEAPARRRAAAVATTAPGAAAAAQEQRSSNATDGAPVDKGLTVLSLQEYARMKKLERERKKEEMEARVRATKLAAAQRLSEVSAGPAWNPAAAAAQTRLGGSRRSLATLGEAQAPTGAGSHRSRPASSTSSGGGSSGAGTGRSVRAAGGEERQSISSGPSQGTKPQPPQAAAEAPAASAQAQPQAAAEGGDVGVAVAAQNVPQQPAVPPAPSLVQGNGAPVPLPGPAAGLGQRSAGSGAGWSPRKLPRLPLGSSSNATAVAPGGGPPKSARSLQLPAHHGSAQQQHQQQRVGSRAGTLSARGPAPAPVAPGTAAPRCQVQQQAASRSALPLQAPAQAHGAAAGSSVRTEEAELDSAELEARRSRRLVDWSRLLVQATATAAAERLLLGPAAKQDSHPLTAQELPLTFGQRPPSGPGARAAAARQQVATALEVLERQRQAKLALLAAAEEPGALQLPAADRQLLQAEAAADLQAQSLLAHWAVQAVCEAREAAGQLEVAGQRLHP